MHLRSLFPPVAKSPPTNFHNVLLRGTGQKNIPEHVLQIDGISGQKRTRSEFFERVYDGATALGASKETGGLGFTSSDIVGILSDNCLDYMVLVNSLLVLTTPFVMFSTYATQREMRHNLTKSNPTHIFVHAALLPSFLAVAREVGFPEDCVYILDGQPTTGPSPSSLGQLIDRARKNKIPREPVREAGNDTLAYLAFSSGTSGLPKAVMVSHGNLIFSVLQSALYAKYFDISQGEEQNVDIPVVLVCLPFFHVYSLQVSCFRSLLRPQTGVIIPRWNLDLAIKLIPRYRISGMLSIPSIIHQLVHSPQFKKIDRSSLSMIASGAAYLSPQLKDQMRQLVPENVDFLQAYGMSESTLTILLRPPPGLVKAHEEDIVSSTGILLPGQEAMVLRPDGTHCLPNEPGELYIKGGNVTLGYWNDAKVTEKTFLPTGWLRTGDILRAKNSGLFWFEDRAKDILKVSGLQVAPAEIEDVLLADPDGLVKDVAVAGVQTPGARTSDDVSPRAWIVLSSRGLQLGEAQSQRKLEEWTKKNLSKYKWLRGGIQFVQEIPKNPTGKTLRRVLQKRYADTSFQAKL